MCFSDHHICRGQESSLWHLGQHQGKQNRQNKETHLLADNLRANRSQRGVHVSQDAGVAFIRARRTMGLGKRRPPRAGAVLFLRAGKDIPNSTAATTVVNAHSSSLSPLPDPKDTLPTRHLHYETHPTAVKGFLVTLMLLKASLSTSDKHLKRLAL